jgi:hypothetical protein
VARPRKRKDPRPRWAPHVGRFILSFGDIENVTYLALLQLPKDAIYKTTSTLSFSKRVDLVIELVEGHKNVSKRLRARFSEKLKSAKHLSGTRNQVAHSPLVLKVYTHPGYGWTHSEFGLANAKNREKAMSLATLKKAASQAERLADSLYGLYGKIHAQVTK